MNKTKVVILYGAYIPAKNAGGPITSLRNIVEQCGNEIEFYIITRNHDIGDKTPFDLPENKILEVGRGKVIYLSDNNYTGKNIKQKICEINPDIIYQNSMCSYKNLFTALNISSKKNKKLIIAPRGELCENAFKHKYIKKIIYFKLIKILLKKYKYIIHSTSKMETEAISKRLKIKADKIIEIPNIPTLPSKYLCNDDVNNYNTKEIKKLKIVFMSRIHRIKNLKLCIQSLKGINIDGEILFDIYGPVEEKGYFEECMELSKTIPDNIKISYKGELEKKQVHQTLSKYDVFFVPTYNENYGHAIVEAMLAGCLIITSDQTPWQQGRYRCINSINLNDTEKFREVIVEYYNLDQEEYKKNLYELIKYIDENLFIKKSIEDYLKLMS